MNTWKLPIALLLLPLALHCNGLASAQTAIAVVVSEKSELTSLSREDLAALYLGNLGAKTGTRELKPIDLEDSETRDKFYQILLGRSRNQMHAYWSRLVFTNRARPPKEYKEDEIVNTLISNSSTIGYLPQSQIKPGMRVLLTIN
jgi:ABC-type phosphate transport system substrate-binding protein